MNNVTCFLPEEFICKKWRRSYKFHFLFRQSSDYGDTQFSVSASISPLESFNPFEMIWSQFSSVLMVLGSFMVALTFCHNFYDQIHGGHLQWTATFLAFLAVISFNVNNLIVCDSENEVLLVVNLILSLTILIVDISVLCDINRRSSFDIKEEIL